MGTVRKNVTISVTGSISQPELHVEGAKYHMMLSSNGKDGSVVWSMGKRDILVEGDLDVLCQQYGTNGATMTVEIDIDGTSTKTTSQYINGIATVRKSIP